MMAEPDTQQRGLSPRQLVNLWRVGMVGMSLGLACDLVMRPWWTLPRLIGSSVFGVFGLVLTLYATSQFHTDCG